MKAIGSTLKPVKFDVRGIIYVNGYETRGSGWDYIGIYGNSQKLPDIVIVENLQLMEARRRLHTHQQCAFPSAFKEVSTNVHGSKYTFMEENLIPRKQICFHGSRSTFMDIGECSHGSKSRQRVKHGGGLDPDKEGVYTEHTW